MSDEFPKSINLAAHRACDGRFLITAASWDSMGNGDSYEIGVRDIPNKDSILLQAAWNEDTVLQAAFLIARALDGGFMFSHLREVFP